MFVQKVRLCERIILIVSYIHLLVIGQVCGCTTHILETESLSTSQRKKRKSHLTEQTIFYLSSKYGKKEIFMCPLNPICFCLPTQTAIPVKRNAPDWLFQQHLSH